MTSGSVLRVYRFHWLVRMKDKRTSSLVVFSNYQCLIHSKILLDNLISAPFLPSRKLCSHYFFFFCVCVSFRWGEFLCSHKNPLGPAFLICLYMLWFNLSDSKHHTAVCLLPPTIQWDGEENHKKWQQKWIEIKTV